ncbi:helix-turn-helix transcriptional regulator [Nocardia sp. NPDC004860]|uniref:helix-turn-helix domain-containing protein n=1 Tax=Nocardia sp. NPDC004860 TaxID=3154557 RepID=UPI0033B713DC
MNAGEPDTVGHLLRQWRHRRGLSQLEFACLADVSARHVSFVETGRTIPSQAMLLRLADHLEVPLAQRNRLLVAAGYAPIFQHRDWHTAPELAVARAAVEQILAGHEPFPALVLDSRWNLLSANAGAAVFFDGVDPDLLSPPANMMRLGLHPRGFASRVGNVAQVRGRLLARLARQVAQTGDPVLAALHDEVRGYGGDDDPAFSAEGIDDIALPIRLRHRDHDLTFINTVTTFGTATDLTLADVVVESYYPADAITRDALRNLAAGRLSA